MSELAGDLRGYLSGRPGELVPVWTSVRSVPPALELGTHDDLVSRVPATLDARGVTGGYNGRARLCGPRPTRRPDPGDQRRPLLARHLE